MKQLISKSISPLQAFQMFDQNNDGQISKQEFSTALTGMDIAISSDDMDILFLFVDIDGTGILEYKEFIGRLRRSGVKVRRKDEELIFTLYKAFTMAGLTLRKAFEAFDSNGDNQISLKDMTDTLTSMGIVVAKETIEFVFNLADSSGDGQINYQEFERLFGNFVKESLNDEKKGGDDTLDWKYAVVLKMDAAIRSENLSMLDAFQIIDRDSDQSISHDEFLGMFQQMNMDVSADDVRKLFEAITGNHNGDISYNQLLNFLRDAKREEEKIRRFKVIQKRTEELKDSLLLGPEVEMDQLPQMNSENRSEMKLAILELREKNFKRRHEQLDTQFQQQTKLVADMNLTILDLEKAVVRANENYYLEKEESLKFQERSVKTISREESERLQYKNDQLTLENVELKAALTTFKNLYEVSVNHTKTMRMVLERGKHETEQLQLALRDLQATADEKALIGKLYHQVMVSRWNEGQMNKKFDGQMDLLRKFKIEAASIQTQLGEREEEIIEVYALLREKAML